MDALIHYRSLRLYHQGRTRLRARVGLLHGRPDRGRGREGALGRAGRRLRMADVNDLPTFDFELSTPDGPVFVGDAHMLIVPGAAGEIGVLARHAPLVATLKAGSTRVHVGANEVLEYATGPGFFKVELDRALALVDDAVG